MKLLALFRFWNIYEYFSPNITITKTDWDEVLKESIKQIPYADNYREYVLEIAQTATQTGDAHLTVMDPERTLADYYGIRYLPCSLIHIDGQMVIRQVAEHEKQLKQGDILLEIDHGKMEDRIAGLRRYKALPDDTKLMNQMEFNLLKTRNTTADIQVLRNGKTLAFEVKTSKKAYIFQNPYQNGWLKPNEIGYIDPSALEKGDLEEFMGTFSDSRGIIIDLRYYPSEDILYSLAEYLNPEPTVFARIGLPNPAIPGSFYQIEMTSGSGTGDNGENVEKVPQYTGKVILLMNENTQSSGEFTVMSLRQAPNATVVGSPSIGADGNVVRVDLPGQIYLYISGLGVYTPEGGQTQRIGLTPDVEIFPTLKGIQENRDELIEKSIELIEAIA